MHNMTPRLKEILVISQEEAAEVIQEISKCFRFGLNSNHKNGRVHRDALESEIGDFLAMVDLLLEEGVVTESGLSAAKQQKIEKLKVWSEIFRK